MIKVGVIGATGYAGADLVRILYKHPETELTVITSRQYAGRPLAEVYPAFAGVINLVCENFDPDQACEKADIFFTALPHKLPMAIVPELVKRGKRVIDLSADFRFRNVDAYEAHYQPHTARELSEKAVYGLCEIYHDDIRKADVIGNPGCYPTSVTLPLIPLIRAGFLDTGSLISDSKSGVSGAGRSLALGSHFSEVNESFKAYKAASHRHNPEMNEVLGREAGHPVSLTFVPHLVPMTRGMLTTTYASLKKTVEPDELLACLSGFYKGRPFVRVCEKGRMPDTRHVRGTNFCDIGLTVDRASNRLVLVSAIDNLVKGAAGQAVQNMNIMLGIREDAGLDAVPYPI